MSSRLDRVELPRTPDFGHWPVQHRPIDAEIEAHTVCVTWDDGRVSRYHFRWLRDGCACIECVSTGSREQLLDIARVDPRVHPISATIDASASLVVTWDGDGHCSRFHPGWLRAHDYSNESGDMPTPDPGAHDPIVPWDASFAARIPTFSADAVLEDDDALYDWLHALRVHGLTRLRDLHRSDDAIERVAARIGVLRESNFGRTFDVRSKIDADSNAYTPVELPPHTDLPTRESQPGIQMLHCLCNTARGGESVMVDGFMLAETLRREAPRHFELLSTVAIEFASRSATSEYRFRSPMIVLDAHDRICELRPGALLRAPVRTGFDQMDAVYDAIQHFFRLTADPRLRAVFPIAEGDLLAMDNRRVLHGRNAYSASNGERHLKGCYMDRDELLSRLRVLERTR